MTTVTISPVDGVDDLFCKYPGQFEAQPVELSLDIRTGALRCDYDPSVGGGTTFDHHHRLILATNIPCLTADAANALMAEVAPLAQQVLDGAEQHWDGNNTVGVLTEDGSAAWDQIVEVCGEHAEDQEIVTSWEVGDWFTEGDKSTAESLGITADTTDTELGEIAAAESERAGREAELYGYAVLDVDDVTAHLTAVRDQLRETVRGELVIAAAALTEARQRRDGLVRRVKGWGVEADTWRSIGDLAGIDHTSVGRILRGGAPQKPFMVAQPQIVLVNDEIPEMVTFADFPETRFGDVR